MLRRTTAPRPTLTCCTCSRKPESSSSVLGCSGWGSLGSVSASQALKVEACRVGKSAGETIERITSRIESVLTTRAMPRR